MVQDAISLQRQSESKHSGTKMCYQRGWRHPGVPQTLCQSKHFKKVLQGHLENHLVFKVKMAPGANHNMLGCLKAVARETQSAFQHNRHAFRPMQASKYARGRFWAK